MRLRDRAGADRCGRVILGAAALGAVIRLAVTLGWARTPTGLYDPSRYFGYAKAIADGNGMIDPFTFNPTAYFPPGYPFLLAGLLVPCRALGIEGSFPEVVGVFQSLVAGAGIVMTGMLGRRVGGGRVGAVAAVVVALMPNLVAHAAVMLSETVSMTVMVAFLLVALPPDGVALTRSRLVSAGILLGALLLLRPVIAGVLVAVVVAWALQRVGGRTLLTRSAAVVGVGLLCVAPWTIRNAIRLDAFVPLSTNTGDNLCIGHAPGAIGAFRFLPACLVEGDITQGPQGEVEGDAAKRRLALDYAVERWDRQPGLVGARLRYTVRDDFDGILAMESYLNDPWMSADTRKTIWRVSDVTWFVVGLVGVVGMVRLAWTRRPDAVVVVISIVAVFAVPLATFGDPRFKVPAVPLLAIAGAALAVEVFGAVSSRARRAPPR